MAGSPKHLVKKKAGDIPSDIPEEDARWNLFIDSRKGEGKWQAVEIFNLLRTEETESDWKWIPFTIIEKHLKESHNVTKQRLIHLLNDMEQNHIIDKKIVIDSSLKTANKKRTFYKYDYRAENSIKTKKGYEKAWRELQYENSGLEQRYYSAMYVLNKHQLLNEYFKDYFGERPRPDDPTDYHDIARSLVLTMNTKHQKKVQRMIEKGYGKDESDVLLRCITEFIEAYKKDPRSISGPLIEIK